MVLFCGWSFAVFGSWMTTLAAAIATKQVMMRSRAIIAKLDGIDTEINKMIKDFELQFAFNTP